MAKAGLSFFDPVLTSAGLGLPARPNAPFDPNMAATGVDSIAPAADPFSGAREALKSQFSSTAMVKPQAAPSGPNVAYDPTSKKLFVNGLLFDEGDAASALKSQEYLNQPTAAVPAGNWVPLDQASYTSYIESIKNPGAGELFKKNVGLGFAGSQQLIGAGLQFAGAEELGASIVEDAKATQEKLSPYARKVEDIRSGGQLIDWFAATAGQLAPSVLETVISSGAGAMAAGSVGTPLAAPAGALAGLVGKTAFKKAIFEALEKKAAGTALSVAEKNTLKSAGAITAVALNNYRTGVSDIYSELRESGSEADDMGARVLALVGAVPWAAADSAAEFILGARILKNIPGFSIADTASKRGRLLKGVGIGGTLEGSAELTQELITTGAAQLANNKDMLSDEALSRYVNSFAAGFAFGAPIGGIVNLAAGGPVDLTQGQPEPETAPETGEPLMLRDFRSAQERQADGSPMPAGMLALRDMRSVQEQRPTDQVMLPAPEGQLQTTPELTGPAGLARLRDFRPAAEQQQIGGEVPLLTYAERPTQGQLPTIAEDVVIYAQSPEGFTALPAEQVLQQIVDTSGGDLGVIGEKLRAAAEQSRVAKEEAQAQADAEQSAVAAQIAEGFRIQEEQFLQQQQALDEQAAGFGAGLSALPAPTVQEQPTLPFKPSALRERRMTAGQLRLVGGAQPNVMPVSTAIVPEPTQGKLFTVAGEPTVAATTTKAGRAKLKAKKQAAAKKAANKLKRQARAQEAVDNLRKPSAAAVAPGKQAGTGTAGGAANLKRGAAATASAQATTAAAAPSQPAVSGQGRPTGVVPNGKVKPVSPEAITKKLNPIIDIFGDEDVLKELETNQKFTDMASDLVEGFFKRKIMVGDAVAELGNNLDMNGVDTNLYDITETLLASDFTSSQRAVVRALILDTLSTMRKGVGLNIKNQSGETVTGKILRKFGALKDVQQAKEDASMDDMGRPKLADVKPPENPGRASRMEYEPGKPVSAIGHEKVVAHVKGLVAKLRMKPNVFVFTNQADMKRQNPALFARAALAHPGSDFATMNADGYAFGDTVLIFSDRIVSTKQLETTFAHEVIGHFGMGAILPGPEFNAMLDEVYDKSAWIRKAAEYKRTTNNIDKQEAIEEVLADLAGRLETSLIARVWDKIKGGLNKMGITFGDELARYTISLAKRYVRDGSTSSVFTPESFIGNVQSFGRTIGRYSTVDDGSQAATNGFASQAMANGKPRSEAMLGLRGKLDNIIDNLKAGRVGRVIASVLEEIQTLDNVASRNEGLSRIFDTFQKVGNNSRALIDKYQSMQKYTRTSKEVSKDDRALADELLAYGALLRNSTATDKLLREAPSLVIVDPAGGYRRNIAGIEKMKASGMISPEEFANGFDVTLANGTVVRKQWPSITKDSPAYKIFVEQRNVVAESAVDQIEARLSGAMAERESSLEEINQIGKRAYSTADMEWFDQVERMYSKMYFERAKIGDDFSVSENPAAAKRANAWLAELLRALHEPAKLNDWLGPKKNKGDTGYELADDYKTPEMQALIAGLKSVAANKLTLEQQLKAMNVIQNLGITYGGTVNAELKAKRSIAGAYVPFVRRGKFQVRLVAYALNGNAVRLAQEVQDTLFYGQFHDNTDAIYAQEGLDNMFGGRTWKLQGEDGAVLEVNLRAERADARQSAPLTESIDYDAFTRALKKFDINIDTDERQRIITGLAGMAERARKSLERSATPGWDPDVLRNIDEHLERSAHVAAKTRYRHELDNVMFNGKLWYGDAEKLARLEKAVADAPAGPARILAERERDQYAYMYEHSAAIGPKGYDTVTVGGVKTVDANGNTTTVGGQVRKLKGRGNSAQEKAKSLLRWYSESPDIVVSTEDLLSTAGSPLKMMTVTLQLGGSVATAVMNLTSLYTHSIPYLAEYNASTGRGGGFGYTAVGKAIHEAMNAVKNPRMADTDFINEIITKKSWAEYGMTEDEIIFLRDQTAEGTLQAAQQNALLGSARGMIRDRLGAQVIQGWMSMFTYTEQLNRRTTALASYRMNRDRLIAGGADPKAFTDAESDAFKYASDEARDSVNYSQGEYAMYNRPAAFRGNIMQYIFMYKMFVVNTMQMIRHLPPRGQIVVLAALFLLSGTKGLPFADDIMDLIDAILQMLNIKMAPVEVELAKFADALIPGSSPIVLRGLMDQYTGASISTRAGMGDLIPLTGAFRAGVDPWREFSNLAGPVFSGVSGLLSTAGGLGAAGISAVTGGPPTDILEVIRNSPVAALRGVTDALVYTTQGAITNARGQVVAEDPTWNVIMFRALGFYPAEATKANDVQRVSKYHDQYAKQIKAKFIGDYVKARMSGDNERVSAVLKKVQAWNRDAKGTGLEIDKFTQAGDRSYKEAARPAFDRYLRTVSKTRQEQSEEMARLYGLED